MSIKRCADVVGSCLALLVLSPLLALAAIAIWLESGRPIFFFQERVGRGFRHFRIVKFRTMHERSPGALVTVGGDPRITRIGRLLRCAKIDEVPQFWNVLRGEMAIVGPRPEVPEYVRIFEDRYRTVLTVRPGITDLASIHFRNEEAILARSTDPLRTYRERILPRKLDLAEKYVQEMNLWCDLKIVAATAIVTLIPPMGRRVVQQAEVQEMMQEWESIEADR